MNNCSKIEMSEIDPLDYVVPLVEFETSSQDWWAFQNYRFYECHKF